MKNLSPRDRLIVYPEGTIGEGRLGSHKMLAQLIQSLDSTGLRIMLGPDIRSWGYGLADELREAGLKFCADLNLAGDKDALERDGEFLAEIKPDMVTVLCATGEGPMTALKNQLPDCAVIGITLFSSQTGKDTQDIFRCSIKSAMLRFANLAKRAKIDGVLCATEDLALARGAVGENMTITVSDVCPAWSLAGRDQGQLMTPEKAIKLGADYIIVNDEIALDHDPRAAAMRTIEEIAKAFAS